MSGTYYSCLCYSIKLREIGGQLLKKISCQTVQCDAASASLARFFVCVFRMFIGKIEGENEERKKTNIPKKVTNPSSRL